jgi:multidrug efflux pump subunit AcrA (membrane-fusion protein)
MRLKIIAAVLLLVIGVGAVGFVLIGPSFGGGSSSTLLTAQATRTNVVDEVVATGSLAPAAVYDLSFGQLPTLANGSSSSSSSSSSGSGAGSTVWPVKTVSVVVGQAVKKGDVLATADDVNATPQLAAAQANLAAAQAKLATDQAGATASDKAAAQLSITQAEQQLTNARTNYSDTLAKNKLSVAAAQAAVTRAKAQLTTDQAASAPANVIAADQAAITNAQQQLASSQQQATQSAHQASQSIASAQLAVTSAQDGYSSKVAPAPAATIASDQAAVATAQVSVDSAKTVVDNATLVAPADGTVATVTAVAGFNAPSGTAISLQTGGMIASGNFPEADIDSLQVGQAATVTVTAVGKSMPAKVTSISPSAATSGSSSVVTYAVQVTLDSTDASLRSGMSASISVTTASASGVIAIPAIALNGTSGDYTVNVVASDGSVSAVPVQVGLVTTSLAQITSGLSVGDRVETGTSTARSGTTTTTTTGGFGGGFGGGRGNGGGTVIVP